MFDMRAFPQTPYLWVRLRNSCLMIMSYTLRSPTARRFARCSRSNGMSRTLLSRS